MSDSPRRQLEAAVAHLNQVPDLDFVVFTGDLVDQADPESFEVFQEILAQLLGYSNTDLRQEDPSVQARRKNHVCYHPCSLRL